MPEFLLFDISIIDGQRKEIAVARILDAGFSTIEETDEGLKVYLGETEDSGSFRKLLSELELKNYTESLIAETNWNDLWESNFEPVVVTDFCAIPADFHAAIKYVQHEIIITPKMSFGTGHHATTYMMIEQMKTIDCKEKIVFDFGTGTGVLAILAEKLGAASVQAIDNDNWSIENAAENISRNNSAKIILYNSEKIPLDVLFDIILANINSNVILENLSHLYNQLKPGGTLLLSGLLVEDEADILAAGLKMNLLPGLILHKTGWVSIRFLK
jgi:ribosomal protein L11 methyltransferase